MQIVLLGYMGSGKSTIGRRLADDLNIRFIDLDEYISLKEGMLIPAIFKEKGEIYFRKKEAESLRKILKEDTDFVLAMGGGTPCYANNMSAILELTPNSFYLKLPINDLVKRLVNEKEQRPLIKNIPDDELAEFIGKHLFERSFYYSKAANKIESQDKTIEGIITEIKDKLL